MTKKVIAHLKGSFSLTGEIRLQFIDIKLAQYLVKHKIPVYLAGKSIQLTPVACRAVSKGIAFKFAEVLNRNDAEKIPKGDIEVQADLLPKATSDNYMIEDFVGFKLRKDNQVFFADVIQSYNFGASDIIECELLIDMLDMKKATVFSIPMTDEIILDINFSTKEILVSDIVDYYLKQDK
jgi:ribosomal 30S subunit maturation factor RimM